MKKLLLTAAAVLAALTMYGQVVPYGIINFANNGATNQTRIWVNDSGRANEGVLAGGTGYQIALYWGAVGTPEDGLIQVGNSAGFLTLTAAGQFVGGNRTLTPQGGNGSVVSLQARAWNVVPGVQSSYEAVLAAGLGGDSRAQVGKGPVFDHKSKDPNNPLEVATPLGGPSGSPFWRGFGVSPVPEPSVIGLGLLGAGALLMLRRRK
jgi:hypothetical protein